MDHDYDFDSDDLTEDDDVHPKDCFGDYQPGTEECDCCEFSDECA